MKIYKTKIILLKKTLYSDDHLILQGLCETGEKRHLIARSALRSKKRFPASLLEPINCLDITYCLKDTHLDLLREAKIVYDFYNLRSSYDKLDMAFYLLRIVGKVAKEGLQEGRGLFDLLGNTLKSLESHENLAALKFHFHLKLLQQQGVLPEEYKSFLHTHYSVLSPELYGKDAPVGSIKQSILHERSYCSKIKSNLEALCNN